jgi:Tfp pilus assembly protein PilO
MKTHMLIVLGTFAALASAAFAETKPAQQSELESILKAVTQMQSDVKALQSTVANLAASQNDQTTRVSAQIKDMSRRLYATCVLTQRLMDVTISGGWSENALCNYKGLTAAGEAVTQDIFGQNPVNIDAPFGGP